MTKKRFFNDDLSHYAAFVAVVLGIKFMVIAVYGMTTPYWDQWDVEIDRLYRPWMDGTLQWQTLLAPHNEHRVFTGRLLALFLFALNGKVLDILLQIVVNALLHTGTLFLFLQGLLNLFSESRVKLLLTLFTALIFAMPLGVENLLINNSALFFLILFSILFLRALTLNSGHGTVGWFGAVLVCGLLVCLSFASGALTLISGIILLGIQWITGVRRNRSTLVMILVLLMMLMTAVYFTPTLPGHAHFKSRSLIDFMISILRMTGGLFFYVPSVMFMLGHIRRKPQAGDPTWFLFAMCLWIFGQMVVIAYGRGHSNVLTSRYLDLYTIGFVANLAALFLNMQDRRLKWSSKLLKVWLLLLFTGFGIFLPQIVGNLEKTKIDSSENERRVRSYLVTHDRKVFDEPEAVIPYPDPVRLGVLLDQEIVQSMLPLNLTGAESLLSRKSGESPRKILFLVGSILAGIGSGLFAIQLFSLCNSHAEESGIGEPTI